MISVKPYREKAIMAGYLAMLDKFPEGLNVNYLEYRRRLEPWDVSAICDDDDPIGMIMQQDNEIHVAVLKKYHGKWISRRLLKEFFTPLFEKYPEIKSKVGDDKKGADFTKRLGFETSDTDSIKILRTGFEKNIFSPGVALGVGSVVSGLMGQDAAETAASQQAQAAKDAQNTQLQMFNTINQQQAPWRRLGEIGLNRIEDLLPQFTHNFDVNDLKTNLAPNYEFQLGQGLRAVKNAGNMQTGLLSGNTLQGINDYAQNYADNAYQNAFNNYQAQQNNIYNRLSNIAGLGQTANQTSATAGTAAGQGIANSQLFQGTANASGTVGGYNAFNKGFGNALGWFLSDKKD